MSKVAKLYEWRGVDSLSLPLIINGVKKVIIFPTGKEKPLTHAQYRTDSEDIQKGIEGTVFFESGQIRVKATYPIIETSVSTTPAAPVGVKTQKYSSVVTIQQAADKLVEKYKVPAEDITTPEAILAKAEEVGALFPNLVVDNLL